MANKSISQLDEISSVDDADVFPVVDVSDLTQSVYGTTKKITAEKATFRPASRVVATSSSGFRADYYTDGTADQVQIQAALNDCPQGGVVALLDEEYVVSSPIIIPPNISLIGQQGRRVINTTETQTLSKISASNDFSGVSIIRMIDKEQGSYSANNNGQRIRYLTIDGSNAPSSVSGIKAEGFVHDVIIDNINLYKLTGNGITTAPYTRQDSSEVWPYSWTIINSIAQECDGTGFYFDGCTDTTLLSVEALGNGSHGFYLTDMTNSHLTSCRAEWSGNHGYYISGSWNSGTGSGGLIMTGCSTDRNDKNGVMIDATGTVPIIINGMMLRRDGRNGQSGGGGYAGIATSSATVKVVINGVTCFPGVDDDGTGTNSPAYGASFTSSSLVVVHTGYLHGATGGWNDGGSNTILRRGTDVILASGTTSSPTITAQSDWNTNGTGTIGLTGADVTGVKITNTQHNSSGPQIDLVTTAATGRILNGSVSGDSVRRYNLLADGTMEWGAGGGSSRDTNLYRSSADNLKTDDTFTASAFKTGTKNIYPRTRTGIAKISAGATQWGLPNTLFFNHGTTALTVNEDRYVPFILEYAVTLTAWIIEVTTGPASDANFRIGIYLADSDMQPSGAPLYDSGSTAVATAYTGTKTATGLSISLTPAVYLIAINCDVAMTLRSFISGSPIIGTALGATPMIQRVSVSRSYAAFPTPGTAWTSTNATAGGLQNFSVWQWTE